MYRKIEQLTATSCFKTLRSSCCFLIKALIFAVQSSLILNSFLQKIAMKNSFGSMGPLTNSEQWEPMLNHLKIDFRGGKIEKCLRCIVQSKIRKRMLPITFLRLSKIANEGDELRKELPPGKNSKCASGAWFYWTNCTKKPYIAKNMQTRLN